MSKYLNAKEYDILCTILNTGTPVTVAQIISAHPELTANIVQPTIRKLLKFGIIEVADIVMNRNIFSRSFQPTAAASDIIQKMFVDEYMQFNKLISSQALHSAILYADSSPDKVNQEIAELEQLLNEYKSNIQKSSHKP